VEGSPSAARGGVSEAKQGGGDMGALSLVAALWLWFAVRDPFAFGLTIDCYAEARAVRYLDGLQTAGVLPAR